LNSTGCLEWRRKSESWSLAVGHELTRGMMNQSRTPITAKAGICSAMRPWAGAAGLTTFMGAPTRIGFQRGSVGPKPSPSSKRPTYAIFPQALANLVVGPAPPALTLRSDATGATVRATKGAAEGAKR